LLHWTGDMTGQVVVDQLPVVVASFISAFAGAIPKTATPKTATARPATKSNETFMAIFSHFRDGECCLLGAVLLWM
jgi:hypothetical protein